MVVGKVAPICRDYLEQRVELFNSTNDYDTRGYMHVKGRWEQYKFRVEVMMVGEEGRIIYRKHPSKASRGKMDCCGDDYRAWVKQRVRW